VARIYDRRLGSTERIFLILWTASILARDKHPARSLADYGQVRANHIIESSR